MVTYRIWAQYVENLWHSNKAKDTKKLSLPELQDNAQRSSSKFEKEPNH